MAADNFTNNVQCAGSVYIFIYAQFMGCFHLQHQLGTFFWCLNKQASTSMAILGAASSSICKGITTKWHTYIHYQSAFTV